MTTGALYIRVSSEEQTEFSPDAQKRMLLDYAIKHKIEIPSQYIFVDKGISGRKATKRPAFMKMITTAKQKPRPFDLILCHKFDRFSRSREDSIVYKSLLRKECGIGVISITEHMEDDKFAVILEAMLEAMAEYYSLNLSDEVKKGMSEKALRGQYQSAPPWGYEMIDKKLVPIPEQQAIYLMMIEKLFTGMRPFSIAKLLNSLGYKTKRGNLFETRTITGILRNPIYCGIVKWDGIIKKCDNEPFISLHEYDKIQQLLDRYSRHHNARPPETLTHWLTGLLYCSTCGGKLSSGGQKRGAFQCSNYSKGKCNLSHSIIYHNISNLVIHAFQTWCPYEETIFQKKTIHFPNDECALKTSALLYLEKKENRLKEAYINEIDTLEDYKYHKNLLHKERLKLLDEINVLTQKSSLPELHIHGIYDILVSDQITKEQKHIALASICKTIIYDKASKSITITLYNN